MLGLLAAGAVMVAMGIGVAGDARPPPDWSSAVGTHGADEAAPASAPRADRPPRGRYDELAAAPRVVPARLVVVRLHSIDSIVSGALVQRTYRDNRALSFAGMAAAVPRAWITVAGDSLRLDAAVQLTFGTRLDGQGVRTLQMAGGGAPQSAAFLDSGRGQIQLRGVTVTSVDPTSGRAVAPEAQGRPYLRVSDGGSLVMHESTVVDLGITAKGNVGGRPAIEFGRGSTGELTRVAVYRASTGVALAASQGVRLDQVTVSDSAGDGIVLHGDRGTALSNVRAERNGANGVSVSGAATGRPVAGIATSGNRSFGVAVSGQNHTEIAHLILSNDQAGGLEVDHVSDSDLHDITVVDAPIGVYLHGSSANPTLDAISVSGGRIGVLIDKTTSTVRLTDSKVERVRVAGIVYEGRDALLAAVSVVDSPTAVRVEPRSGALTVDGLRIVGGVDGLVTSVGAPAVVIKNLTADGVSNDAVRNLAPGMMIVGGRIRGGHTGMDLRAATRVTDTQIDLAATGISVGSGVPVVLGGVRIDAEAVGIAAEPGSSVTLSNSWVHGLEAIRGNVEQRGPNDLSLPPVSGLSAIGLPLILVAILLEFLHLYLHFRRARVRSREYLRRWRAMAAGSTTCATCGTTRAPEVTPEASTAALCGACAPV